MIPKKIHYCWFGYGEKSKLMEKCIASWRKYFPDYEIIEWNESNFDIDQNDYCKEAYESKKWAFVSDYARLKIVYDEGGIYFDTDVEVLKNFSDLITDYGYLCFENTTNDVDKKEVNTGLGFAAEAGSTVIKKILDDYENIHFINDGEMDLIPCPVRNTKALQEIGLIQDGKCQILNDIKVYPFEYFCGYDIANSHPVITDNTYTVHHYAGTWKDEGSLIVKIKYKIIVPILQKILGYDRYDQLIRLKDKRKG
ncbi:MAG: glycosyltransferase [Bacillota bacterium]|nr:glycosyltransferase [Bacillota bacterium]